MITYDTLGVKPFINASGTITTLGGSLMPEEVLEAMCVAGGVLCRFERPARKSR